MLLLRVNRFLLTSILLPSFTAVLRLPKLETAKAGQFRTAISKGAKARANFAGHFALVSWGCGSYVVVDSQSGRVYEPSELVNVEIGRGGSGVSRG